MIYSDLSPLSETHLHSGLTPTVLYISNSDASIIPSVFSWPHRMWVRARTLHTCRTIRSSMLAYSMRVRARTLHTCRAIQHALLPCTDDDKRSHPIPASVPFLSLPRLHG